MAIVKNWEACELKRQKEFRGENGNFKGNRMSQDAQGRMPKLVGPGRGFVKNWGEEDEKRETSALY